MQEFINKGKENKFLIISILVLFLSILGSSVAYYLARVQGTLSGRAAGTELSIEVTKMSNNASGDLIPLNNDLETLGLAAKGYQDKGACVDINGYSVCQIYKVRLTNNGSVPLKVNGTVTLSGTNVPNIDCARMSDEETITSNNSCIGGDVFVSGDNLNAKSYNDYYVMVYIKNLDEPQFDSGEFNGTITFTTEDGRRVKGRFTKPFKLVNHITNLYNNAEKMVVTTYSQGGEVIDTSKTIDYHLAPSVDLMNDRFGDTNTPIDSGNIRYYGSETVFLDSSDGADGQKELGNWETEHLGNLSFDNSDECLSFMQSYNVTDEKISSSTSYSTVEEFCSVSLKYYKSVKNYIDIGDKYETDLEQGNWESVFPGRTKEECETEVASVPEEEIVSITGMNKEEFCSTSMLEAGTPILWRIIGVFDGKLRIVRDENLGYYSWDTSSPNINNGYGINQWGESGEYTGADLMKLLNPGYENNKDTSCTNCQYNSTTNQYDCDCVDNVSVNNSLYWNSGSGMCYRAANNSMMECNFTNTGLSEEAKGYVIDQTIYLGTMSGVGFPNEVYVKERGNSVFQDPSDGVTRTTKWTGKVGLIYPSDYIFASDLSDENCVSNSCSKNWMNRNIGVAPTITPGYSEYSMIDIDNSKLNYGFTYSSGNVWPTLLLDSSVLAESGNGSKETPYVVAY